MPSIALTDLSLRSLKAEVRADYWDTKTPSFGVRVGKRTKTFIAKLNNRRITIGAYPLISLQDARRRALGLKSDKRTGLRRSLSFKQAHAQFVAIHVPTLKPSTQKQIKRNLERHFLPTLGSKKLDNIEHQDITDITDALVPTPSQAWHAFKDIRTFFKWCVPRYIKHSPMEGLKSPTKYTPRKRVLTYDELLSVWQHLTAVGYPFGDILQLLILTGQRRSEIASLRWEYINEVERTITLPETKNQTEHTFPYGDMVAAIFDRIPRRNSTSLLFPGRDDATPWGGFGKSKWEFNKGCELAPWQILDLRRTFGTKLAELKVPPHIVERLLNHKLGSLQTAGVITAVASVYNRALYVPEMREAIQVWETRLEALFQSSPPLIPSAAIEVAALVS